MHRHLLPAVLLPLVATTAGIAANPASPPASTSPSEPPVTLSPFEVTASSDVGYVATSTLGGTRLNTDLRDVASQVSVMTQEFLDDIAATSFTDAARYSLNIENLDEFQSPTGGAGNFADGVINNTGMTRVRGLDSAGLTHDFFLTSVPLDRYNTERYTLASGPNAILFGLGSPSGTSDAGFKRADLHRRFGSLSLRTDGERSLRAVFDLNAPLVPGRLGLRLVYLNQDENSWRRPAGGNNDRRFLTASAQPFRHTRVRGWYERVRNDDYPMRNMVIRDQMTPWLAAGAPLFDNAGATTSALITNRITAANQGLVFTRYGNASPIFSLGRTGGTPSIDNWANTVATRGPDAALPAPDTTLAGALRDSTIFPWDVAYGGNGTRKYTDAAIGGLLIEQRLRENLYVEAGYNRERATTSFIDSVQGLNTALFVDANRFLPDGATPNPNAGRYYLQGVPRAGVWFNQREDFRLTTSYDLDLTKRSKWFGRHRLAGMLTREESQRTDGQNMNLTIISDHSYTTGTAATELRNANRAVRIRAYVDNPRSADSQGVYWVSLPFNAFDNVTLPDGSRLASLHNPYGAIGSTTITKERITGRMFVMQNYWWDNRLVTTAGWRRDSNRQVNYGTPTKGPGNAPFVHYAELLDDAPGYNRSAGKGTRTLGAVAHPWRWMSLHFSTSKTANVADTGRNADGSIIPGAHGEGRDYGVTLSPFGRRVTLRVNKYEATSGPRNSAPFTSRIRSPIGRVEETVQALGVPPPAVDLSSSDTSLTTVVPQSTRSTGYEAELVGNPTPQWRLSIGLAKSRSVSWDIGRAWISYVKDRSAVWAPYASEFIASVPGRTVTQEMLGIIQALNEMRQVDGASVESGRSWRINGTARYSFNRGALKGLYLGGSTQYRGANTRGYQTRSIPNEFPFPGIGDTVVSADISKPIKGDELFALDGFAGYSRRLFGQRVRWSLQLNIRNLLDDDTTIPLTTYSNGSVRLFTITTPRQFILTSNFEF